MAKEYLWLLVPLSTILFFLGVLVTWEEVCTSHKYLPVDKA